MSSVLQIASIVEGDGEVGAVPVLLRRLAAAIAPAVPVNVLKPIRVPRDQIMRGDSLARYLTLAAASCGPRDAVLVLVDSDNDLPCQAGPALLERCRTLRPDLRIMAVLAHHEFENWFIAAAGSLRGYKGLPDDLAPPVDPEGIRGAKEWLRRQQRPPFRYQETVDQPAFADRLDLAAARFADSFDKLYREMEQVLRPLAP